MKRASEFVTQGLPVEPLLQEDRSFEFAQPLSSHHHPSDLPRDYGMAGATGAYEVKPLSTALQQAVKTMTAELNTAPDAATLVREALDALLPPAARHKVAVEHIANGTIVLSLAQARDRFLYTRTLLPKLKLALRPTLGANVRIQLTDRL